MNQDSHSFYERYCRCVGHNVIIESTVDIYGEIHNLCLLKEKCSCDGKCPRFINNVLH